MNDGHRALAIDIDGPFQQVLAAWLGERGYEVVFTDLPYVDAGGGPVELVVCELAEPKRTGSETLRLLARVHPGALLVAISTRFVDGERRGALARQLGADAALAKPFPRAELYAALEAASSRRGVHDGCT
ncbi:response regulator [Ramlibacter sp. G-1-2-2]|uniref:Response regulator n=1 Tax=Ramlibacter agri TaxID=2728837 RepID=A0A848H9S7_9BURK|nr:response regulator [Ramlibacter agri]NML46201.1 response regulator [Ramlibacter agri]